MWPMPSARSCSRIAYRPVRATATPSPASGLSVLPAIPGQALLEDLDHLLAGEIRVRCGAPGDERVVDDDRRGVAHVADVLAVGRGGVAEDVLERVRRRAHVEHDADEARAVLVVVLLAVPGDALARDDALAVAEVAGEGERGDAVALGADRLAELLEQ